VDECKPLPMKSRLVSIGEDDNVFTQYQGLTLVHFSAQRERFLWDRGCLWGLFRGCLAGVRDHYGVFRV